MAQLWNIRGVSEEHRRMAKGAAGAKGQAIGKWLEHAIDITAGGEMDDRARARKEAEKWEGVSSFDPSPEIRKLTVEQARTIRENFVGPNDEPREEPVLTREHLEEVVKLGLDKLDRGVKKREPKRCAHGEAKGNNCWQCGGLAVIE